MNKITKLIEKKINKNSRFDFFNEKQAKVILCTIFAIKYDLENDNFKATHFNQNLSIFDEHVKQYILIIHNSVIRCLI